MASDPIPLACIGAVVIGVTIWALRRRRLRRRYVSPGVAEGELYIAKLRAAPGVWFRAIPQCSPWRLSDSGTFEAYTDDDGQLYFRRVPRPAGLPV